MGVVGSQVAQTLLSKPERWAQHVGRPLELHGVLVRDPARERRLPIEPGLLTTDPASLIDNPDVDIIVELMGGVDPAVRHLRAALEKGKHVVTANKEVMATRGQELLQLAEKAGLNLLYEASVAGGIPIIGPLRKDLLANEFTSLHAIINGTTNYILTRMSQEGLDFESALRNAQALGYAEPDPTNDVEGIDAAYKLAVLTSLAFHTQVSDQDIYREGISRLAPRDFQYAREFGFEIKLLGIARRKNNELSLRVHPALVPQEHLLAKVDGAFNAVEFEGDLVGRVVFHGQGAGPEPTSSAVLGDILEAARGIVIGRKPPQRGALNHGLRVVPLEELATEYYVRMTLADRAGVLAKLTAILGELDISIASVIQKGADPEGKTAEFVVMTHTSRESHVREAIRQMESLEAVGEVSSLIRVERWT